MPTGQPQTPGPRGCVKGPRPDIPVPGRCSHTGLLVRAVEDILRLEMGWCSLPSATSVDAVWRRIDADLHCRLSQSKAPLLPGVDGCIGLDEGHW